MHSFIIQRENWTCAKQKARLSLKHASGCEDECRVWSLVQEELLRTVTHFLSLSHETLFSLWVNTTHSPQTGFWPGRTHDRKQMMTNHLPKDLEAVTYELKVDLSCWWCHVGYFSCSVNFYCMWSIRYELDKLPEYATKVLIPKIK